MATIHYDTNARRMLIDGANTFARAVGSTLGPGGRTVVIRKRDVNAITKDGVTVAREIDLENPIHAAGAVMIREAAEEAVKIAGDGTTTVSVLAHTLLVEGEKLLVAGFNLRDIQRGMASAVTSICRALDAMAKPCGDREALYRVALVSSNGDEEVANIVADALTVAGPHGIVSIETGYQPHSSMRHVEGMQFGQGWVSPDLVNDLITMRAKHQDCFVLICACHLFRMEPLAGIFDKVYHSGKPLLIVAHSVSGQVLNTLTINLKRGTLKAVAVTAPYFADIQGEALRDIAAVTGAKIHDPYLGSRLEAMTLADLGTAAAVVVDKRSTTIIGGGGSAESITERRDTLLRQISREESPTERERLSERLSKIVGGASIISVGGSTETEIKERRDRFDDALHAARAAMDGGVVPGGGVALLRASQGLVWRGGEFSESESQGIRLVITACEHPLRLIAKNAGANGDHIVAAVKAMRDVGGWNAATGEIAADMHLAGIVDPLKVAKTALEKAVSVASLMLASGCVIYKQKKGGKNGR
jgi:chaperonin GroEL